MAKPEQDFRFDVPCFGPKTIQTMLDACASVLAVEANRTYILEKEKTIKLANKNKIVIAQIIIKRLAFVNERLTVPRFISEPIQ